MYIIAYINSKLILFLCARASLPLSVLKKKGLTHEGVYLVSRLQLVHATKHQSCHLLLLICVSVAEQSAPTETRSLFVRKG